MNDRIDQKLTEEIDYFFDLTPTDPGFGVKDILKGIGIAIAEFFSGTAVAVCIFFGIELI